MAVSEPPKKRPERGAIRTMKTDVDALLNKEKTSFLDLFAKQSQLRYEKGYKAPRRSGTNNARGFLIALIIIIIFGGGGSAAYFLYFKKTDVTHPVNTEPNIPRPFLEVDGTTKLREDTGDRTGFYLSFEKAREDYIGDTKLRYLPLIIDDYETSTFIARPVDFFNLLDMRVPGDFKDAITNNWNLYMFYKNGRSDTVMLFRTTDSARALGGLLAWEKSMLSSFRSFLTEQPGPGGHPFEDEVIKNVDMRISQLSDDPNYIIGYTIFAGKYVIISTSRDALIYTVARLAAGPVYDPK